MGSYCEPSFADFYFSSWDFTFMNVLCRRKMMGRIKNSVDAANIWMIGFVSYYNYFEYFSTKNTLCVSKGQEIMILLRNLLKIFHCFYLNTSFIEANIFYLAADRFSRGYQCIFNACPK